MPINYSTTSTEQLTSLAFEKKLESYEHVVTYSPKAFFPLTMLCRDRCGYCTFAKAPARITTSYMTFQEIRDLGRAARRLGCREALFTLGEKPELRYKSARDELQRLGFESTVDYLVEACRIALEELDLLPHPNAGALTASELRTLKEVSVSQGMMLETLRNDLAAHRLAPDKVPQKRLEVLKAAGEQQIPFTTGILVGIGESEQDRIEALEQIADLHRTYGHIQEVIVQNFIPKHNTAMAAWDRPSLESHIRSVAIARLILPRDVHIQIPPNLTEDITALIRAGADDLGGISPITVDHINPERPWPDVEIITKTLADEGFELVPRTPLHPAFVSKDGFVSTKVRPYLLRHIDSAGLAREDEFCSGTTAKIEVERWFSLETKRSNYPLTEIFDVVEHGEELDEVQIQTLFNTRGTDVKRVVDFADHMRAKINGDVVTFVSNRNINYTNICTFKCRFCAFSKGPLSLNLRGDPYLLSMEEILAKVYEAKSAGATEVCLQGGIHPTFDADFYVNLISTISSEIPDIHIHAFSALEVLQGAKRSGLELREYLQTLYQAGLRTLPGTAAEILDDPIRNIICPDKLTSAEWLEVHEIAHEVGFRSNVTIMFGTVETSESWVKHIVATRTLQQRTKGFTEFVPLPFVHMGSPIYLKGNARKGPTYRETLLMHAVGRLAYAHTITNIQASWVKLGPAGARSLLRAGANDLGGTLMEESISHSAGSEHASMQTIAELNEIAKPLGRTLMQRSTLYRIINEKPKDNEQLITYAQRQRIPLKSHI